MCVDIPIELVNQEPAIGDQFVGRYTKSWASKTILKECGESRDSICWSTLSHGNVTSVQLTIKIMERWLEAVEMYRGMSGAGTLIS